MKNLKLFSVFILCSLFNACGSKSELKSVIVHKKEKPRSIVIQIQPFGNVNTGYLIFVKNSLFKDFPSVKILPKMNLPQKAIVGVEHRYDAKIMLAFLQSLYVTRKYPKETFLVGVTESAICQNRQETKKWKGKKGYGALDYRIMGLGNLVKSKDNVPSQKVNINSTERLNTNKKEQLVKLIKHELGHNFGLPHCPNKSCIMRDAEGGNHFDEMTVFCKKCKLQFAITTK